MYTPEIIADWFLCKADRMPKPSMTNLKLQKLVYYAQAWSLVFLAEPLFNDDFQAWVHGPVIVELYNKYKKNPYALNIPENCPELNKNVVDILIQVLNVYGRYNAKYLEGLTHSEEPWINARGGISPEARSNNIISKEEIKKYYSNLLVSAQTA